MKKLTPEIKLNIQLGIAVVLVTAGLVLLFCGFWVSPPGEIHNSVLVGFGEALSFAGALFGVDYSYKFREWRDRKRDEKNNE